MTARLMIPTRAALLAISLAGLVACSGPEKADEAAKPVALVTTAVASRCTVVPATGSSFIPSASICSIPLNAARAITPTSEAQSYRTRSDPNP